ncbi:hypothetical protein GCM10022245_42480 [Streptomyces mayteni]
MPEHGDRTWATLVHTPRRWTRVVLLGEAKATAARRGTGDLQRLERIRALLTEQGCQTAETTLALFSPHGFHSDVRELAARRNDVLLVDLTTLYGVDDV